MFIWRSFHFELRHTITPRYDPVCDLYNNNCFHNYILQGGLEKLRLDCHRMGLCATGCSFCHETKAPVWSDQERQEVSLACYGFFHREDLRMELMEAIAQQPGGTSSGGDGNHQQPGTRSLGPGSEPMAYYGKALHRYAGFYCSIWTVTVD